MALRDITDEELIYGSLKGDAQSFALLVNRYQKPLVTLIRYRIKNIDDAEDVFQETLMNAWLSLGHLKDHRKIKPWLLQIARNQCRDFYRSAQRRYLPTERGELDYIVSRCGRDLDRSYYRIELEEAMNAVSKPQWDAIKLFYFEGLTIAEIAEREKCPQGTVKRRLCYARNHLRHLLKAEEHQKGGKSK
jgi:RNA polymerase sigma-70 factor (ECF subfamily)